MHTGDKGEPSTVWKMYSVGLASCVFPTSLGGRRAVERGFLFPRCQFTNMETEAQKGQPTYLEAGGQETETLCIQASLLPIPAPPTHTPSLSAGRALTRDLDHLVFQGMRIRFQKTWPTAFHFSATRAKRETRGMAEKMLTQGELVLWEV